MTQGKIKKLIASGYLPKKTIWQKLMSFLFKRKYQWSVDQFSCARYAVYHYGFSNKYGQYVHIKSYKVMKDIKV